MASGIIPGMVVSHVMFGEGTVVSVKGDTADVNFLNVGKKTVLSSYLKIVNANAKIGREIDERIYQYKKITYLNVVDFAIKIMSKRNQVKIKVLECVKIVRGEFGDDIPADFIIKAVDPILDIVFLKHLLKRQKRLTSNKSENIVYKKEAKEEPTIFESISDINDFECASMKEKFDTTIKLFFAREIIKYASNIKKPDPVNILYLRSVSESILNVLLKQMSINFFYNDSEKGNPPFYTTIFNYIQDNKLTDNETQQSVDLIGRYLSSMIINQFLIVNGKRSNKIYLIDKNNNLLFSPEFIKFLNKKGAALDKRIVNRIKYFFSKNNEYSSQLQHYIDYLGKDDVPTKEIILKFEYEENLKELSKELTDDLILKNDFKALMKKHGIPTNENYFKMCMARIDYTLRSKRIILRNKYKSVTAYYREQALKGDVYRYSNPYNLDEYDIIIKSLISNLDLIDVGYGVYITKTNMIKNGITDTVIERFKKDIVDVVKKARFISLREVMEIMNDDKVVQ